jgi:hypothetical protein
MSSVPAHDQADREGWTDEQLVSRILAGEKPLYEILVRRHNQRLFPGMPTRRAAGFATAAGRSIGEFARIANMKSSAPPTLNAYAIHRTP